MQTPRILAIRDGTEQPLFGPVLHSPPSPSASMPVETHAFDAGDWQTHSIPQQMITLFLRPATALHAEGNGPVRQLPIAARSVAFSLRQREESMRWVTPVAFTSITLDDALLSQDGHFELQAAPAVHDERLSALMYALHLEGAGGFAAGRLFVDSIEQALAALLVTQYNLYRQRRPSPALSSSAAAAPIALPQHAARRVRDYLHANLARPIGLADLAQIADMSQSHFHRLFRASFGMPPHQYLLQLRIEHAKLLLAAKTHTMLEVALLSGFANAQHFSRTFTKVTGISPSTYRRQQQ